MGVLRPYSTCTSAMCQKKPTSGGGSGGGGDNDDNDNDGDGAAAPAPQRTAAASIAGTIVARDACSAPPRRIDKEWDGLNGRNTFIHGIRKADFVKVLQTRRFDRRIDLS
eukprot:COSAG01_NODE_11838_length_1849_cov_1.926857_2_plen_110_part_00